MTREEAIAIFKDWDGYFLGHSSDDVNEALDMAIEVLEQEPMLNKIRAEIVEEQRSWLDIDPEWKECQRVLQIIDKYRKEQK